MMGVWIYRGAIMVAMVTGISAQTCPEVCFCSGTKVQCDSLSEESELQWSVDDMPVGTETLVLSDYRSRGIKARTFFRLTQLRSLEIESGRLLVSLVKDTFLGLSSLENLTISGTALQSFPDRLFEPLDKLTRLNIINTPVSSFGELNFIGLTSLKHLRIINNGRLTIISPKALEPLVNLQSLEIQGSRKLSIGSGVFSKLSELTLLDLSAVKINSPMDVGSFVGLSKLKSLILRNSGLRSIEKTVLQPVSASLEDLDISKNEIIIFRANTFADCRMLRNLNISSNSPRDGKIVYEARIFNGLTKLAHLDLSFTDLRNLTTENLIKVLKPVKKAKIQAVGCKYHCSCNAADLAHWIQRNAVTISLSCNTPTWLTGKPVSELDLDTLKCTKPIEGTRQNRFQVASSGKLNATAIVTCEAYTFHGFPKMSYKMLQGKPFAEEYTSLTTEHLYDEESRYNSYLKITVDNFKGETPGKISCKATNEYGDTEWVVDIPRIPDMKKNVSSENIFMNLPTWVFGAVGVGAVLFLIIFALVLAWRIRVRRRERDALRHTNKNSDYYLECEKYEKYKIPTDT